MASTGSKREREGGVKGERERGVRGEREHYMKINARYIVAEA